MVMLPNGGLQQRPGPNAALGQIKFEMENRFDVYLHDTPSKNLFSRDNRRISHGCIRVENAAAIGRPADASNRSIRSIRRSRRATPREAICRRRCRCSWSTRPRSSTPTARCNFAPTSTTATPRSGRTSIRCGTRWRNARRRPTSRLSFDHDRWACNRRSRAPGTSICKEAVSLYAIRRSGQRAIDPRALFPNRFG